MNSLISSNFPKPTQTGYGVEIILMVSDVEEYYEKLQGFAHVVKKSGLRPWDLQDFRIEDPIGYYLSEDV